jgi:hypothetical protein
MVAGMEPERAESGLAALVPDRRDGLTLFAAEPGLGAVGRGLREGEAGSEHTGHVQADESSTSEAGGPVR